MKAPDKIASDCITRTIERLRALPDYAGRPSWDKIVAEEMTSAFQARTSAHPVTVEMLERWAGNIFRDNQHDTYDEIRAAIAQMENGK